MSVDHSDKKFHHNYAINSLYTKIIKNILKNERVRRDIYYYTESFKKNRNKNNIETCSKMKEDVGIVITNNYNIAVNFEYCLQKLRNKANILNYAIKLTFPSPTTYPFHNDYCLVINSKK